MSEQIVEASSDHQIILGDCLAGMKELGAGSVGVVMTDAPYSAHVHKNLGREDRSDGARARVELSFSCLTTEMAGAVASEACRLAGRWLIFFCDEQSIGMWTGALEAAGGEYVRTGTWVKTDPMPQMTGDRPSAGTESIVIGHAPRTHGRMRWHGGGKPATWTGSIRSEGARVHPAQKPEWLMLALVRDFTDPGELVLDPFAGSGTTGVACKRLGRRFLGFERDPKFHAAAVKRLDGTRQQFEFAPRPAKPKQMGLIK